MPRRFFRLFLSLLIAIAFPSVRAIDVAHFELIKGIHYFQIEPGAVRLQTNNMYRFSAQVYADVVGDVLRASVITPRSQDLSLLADADGDPFRFRQKYDDAFSLESNFPNGTYYFTIVGLHDDSRTMTFTISGDNYPAAPILGNFEDIQNLPFSEYNEFTWQPFAGGTVNDFIQLQIEDQIGHNIWETPDYGEKGALNGLDTHTIMPPGTLSPGLLYIGTIRFVKALQNGSPAYPGAQGTVGYYSQTQFPVRPVSPRISPVVDRLQLWRTRRFDQFVDGPPVDQPHPWEFTSQIDAINTNQISAVQLTLPTGQIRPFDTNSDLTQFAYSDTTLTNVTEFAANYPDGAYTFDITQSDSSVQRTVVNLPAGAFPPEPVLEGLAAFPNHPADQPLTVTWDPWTTAIGDDFIRVELYDGNNKAWDTPSFSSVSHLRADVTSVTIPAANFTPGHNYELRVHFYHVTVSDTRLLPGGIVFGGFDSRTRFQFSTQLPDVPSFRIAEGQYYWQRGTNDYVADPIGPFRFEASATPASSNSLHSAQLTIPTGANLQLAPDATAQFFQFNASAASAEALTSAYPTGVFTMHFDTASDGARTSAVTLASNTLPPLPHIKNFQIMATLPATKDFPISWDPWIGADTNKDDIRFLLTDLAGRVIIDSDDPNTKHPLTVSSNQVIVLGNSQNDRELRANASYIVRLRFEHSKHTENNSYPGARGEVAVFSETAFYISTLDPKQLFRESVLILPTTKEVQIRVSSPQIGRTYALYQSSDLQNWTLVNTQKMTTAILTTFAPVDGAFFKAVLLPYP